MQNYSNAFELQVDLSKCFEPLIEYNKMVEDVIGPINEFVEFIRENFTEGLRELIKIIREITKIHSEICKAIFPIIQNINNLTICETIDNSSPRSPPVLTLKEKAETKLIYYNLKYEKYIYLGASLILTNELYLPAKTIFLGILNFLGLL